MDWHVKLSVRGLRAWRPLVSGKVNYAFRRRDDSGKPWVSIWTPAWHAGRGPYVSIGLGGWAFYRGY